MEHPESAGTAAIAQLRRPLAAAGPNARPMAIVINLLTIVSMFVRNLALLLIFSPSAGLIASLPIVAMALIAAGFVWWQRHSPVNSSPLAFGSPISLRQLASFAAIFVSIQAASSF